LPGRPFPSERGLKARRLFRRSGLLSPVALSLGGYLVQEGWFRSFRTARPIDRNGEPLPWYTYAFKAFLEDRITSSMRVFEYGAGMSSLWYAARVAEVVSVEHDRDWAAELRRDLPANCTLLLEPDADAYVAAIIGHDPFDIVVVDGLERPRAAAAALDGLKDDGVIIWDNSDWPEFAEVLPRLQEHGFRSLDFAGLGPISRAGWRTSVLYRAGNCLGI
jgi:hypothetical protein